MNTTDEYLQHYGVKGMRWGVRRTQEQLDSDSSDASTKKSVQSKVAKNYGSIDVLSNQELQALVTRMNLEQQYSRLSATDNVKISSKGRLWVKERVTKVGNKKVDQLIDFGINKAVDAAIARWAR